MQVVTCEAVYYSQRDSSFKASFVKNWVLPYARRYIYYEHPNTYAKLKQSGFSNLSDLHVVVVERLYYRNIIRHLCIASEKQVETTSVLQVCTRNSGMFLMFLLSLFNQRKCEATFEHHGMDGR